APAAVASSPSTLTRRRPNTSPSTPPVSTVAASATKNASDTHCSASVDAWIEPSSALTAENGREGVRLTAPAEVIVARSVLISTSLDQHIEISKLIRCSGMPPLSTPQLGLAVKRLQMRHHRAGNAALKPLGLSLVQWDALRHLHANPDASLHDLA